MPLRFRSRFWGPWVFLFSLLLNSVSLAADLPKPQSLGKPVPNFRLPDHQGQVHALADLAAQKLVVIALLGTECPLAKLYAVRLSKLAEEYAGRGVTVLGLDANRQDSLADLAAFAKQHDLKFPLLKDSGNKVADFLGAVRTPEVFLLDARRVVRYYGRIDDQYGLGISREEPTRADLKLAIEELLADKAVTVAVTQPVGCHIGRLSKPQPDSPVTYSQQISRILARNCVECHRPGEIGPFSLTEYEEVAGWAATMDEVVQQDRMPPWHADPAHGKFANERRLSDQDKALLHQWVEAGAPQGAVQDLPEPVKYTADWQLPKPPDVVLEMRTKPFVVPATGVVNYQFFIVDPKFTEDKWVTAVEVQPGNRAVVHHALVAIRPPGASDTNLGELDGQMLGVYVPGMRVQAWPEGCARRIEAGGRLIFEMHYTPNGSEQSDISRVGLVFADPATVKRAVLGGKVVQKHFSIPPGEANYRTLATLPPSPVDTELLSLMPHMHLRGKSFQYEACYPDGTVETLLDVPKYDFNWQTNYRLLEPKRMLAGTKLRCVAHYDNSLDNLANPNAEATVTWGAQSWHEMMIGYFEYTVPIGVLEIAEADARRNSNPTATASNERAAHQRATSLMKSYDKNKDGRVTAEELPPQQQSLIKQMDADRDGGVTHAELLQAMLKDMKR